MKISEMNQRERKAFYNIKHAANDLLFVICELRFRALVFRFVLRVVEQGVFQPSEQVAELYGMATTAIYGEGYCCFNPTTVEKELRDINFCGKAWLMERCDKRIAKEGY